MCSRRVATTLFCCSVTGLILAVAPIRATAQELATSEFAVKAAYLYQFGRYVEWPSRSKPDDEPFTICVWAADSLATTLEATVKGEDIRGQRIAAKRLPAIKDLTGCRILFIGRSERDQMAGALRLAQGQPILTVGEGAEFVRSGGMIAFTQLDRKIKFEVNLPAAESATLTVSSQLLRHAVNVKK